ncbi:hypothetical protein GH714_041701 [Hevea brasiliensis]|uniref:DUF1421 domain-containing protein n=1 Tax=Hevea brasiliensis TaxID=3981 RepID=A0A6A6MS32_HEVBR|nr:hypothetical protein GH714_041701 [Hevea brasiliensis]
MKAQQLSSLAMSHSGGSGYPQLPTARILPHALPTASGVGGGSSSSGTGNRVPIDDVVDKVTNMGFPREHVRATVRRLTENGQSVDLNIVLDKLMNDGEVHPQRSWLGRSAFVINCLKQGREYTIIKRLIIVPFVLIGFSSALHPVWRMVSYRRLPSSHCKALSIILFKARRWLEDSVAWAADVVP